MKNLINCLFATAACILFICSCSKSDSSVTSNGVTAADFITVTMNGETYHIEMSPDSVLALYWLGNQQPATDIPQTEIVAYHPPIETATEYFEITFYGDPVTGTFPATMSMDLPSGYYIPVGPSPTDEITITEYGTVNNHIAGTFTGKVVKNGTTDTSTFTCSFRATRLE